MNTKIFLVLIAVVFACFSRADLSDCKKICDERQKSCIPAPVSHAMPCSDVRARCYYYCENFGYPFPEGQVQALLNKSRI
ncbi:hypothetical protein ABPG74_010890 [Tetrahymena malaccensis]